MAQQPVDPERVGEIKLADAVGFRYSDIWPLLIDRDKLDATRGDMGPPAMSLALDIAKANFEAGVLSSEEFAASFTDLSKSMSKSVYFQHLLTNAEMMNWLINAPTCDQLANLYAVSGVLHEPEGELSTVVDQAVMTVLAADYLRMLLEKMASKLECDPRPAIAADMYEYVRDSGIDVHEAAFVDPLACLASSMAFKGSIKAISKHPIFNVASFTGLLHDTRHSGLRAYSAVPSPFFMGVALGFTDDFEKKIFTAIAEGSGPNLIYS